MFSALAANKMFEPELKRKLDPRLGFAVQRFFCLGNVCSSHFFALFIDYFLLSECGLVAWFLAALIPCKTFRTRAQSVKCIWDSTKPNCEVVKHANKRRRILSRRLKMLLLELSFFRRFKFYFLSSWVMTDQWSLAFWLARARLC